MATLKDVAKLACVDVSTVSRALNNTSYIHPDTKKRIMAAVEQLSYKPNILAKGLRQGKRNTIGVVVPRLHLTLYADMMQSIENECRSLGYATMVCITEDDCDLEKDYLNRLRNGFVDGIIIAGTGKNNHLLRDIHIDGLGIIQIVRKQDKSLSSVIADYDACGYDTVKYLYDKGCRNIGLINGSMNYAPYKERYNGFQRAIKELGLNEYCAESPDSINSFGYGYQCTEQLLNNNPKLDAIMAAVDIQGMAALRALKVHGLKVPQDVRLVSLTGHSIGNMLETTMTSLEIPAYEMGRKAVKMLIEEIEAPKDSKPSPQHLVFPASLVERESS